MIPDNLSIDVNKFLERFKYANESTISSKQLGTLSSISILFLDKPS